MFSFSHWKNSSHCPACGGFRVACDNRMLHLLLLLSKNESKGRVGDYRYLRDSPVNVVIYMLASTSTL